MAQDTIPIVYKHNVRLLHWQVVSESGLCENLAVENSQPGPKCETECFYHYAISPTAVPHHVPERGENVTFCAVNVTMCTVNVTFYAKNVTERGGIRYTPLWW